MLSGLMKRENELLNGEIGRIRNRMLEVDMNSEEYERLLNAFEKLIKLQNEVKGSGVDPNTVLVVSSNILAILIIVSYEQGHIIASKGLQFLVRTH